MIQMKSQMDVMLYSKGQPTGQRVAVEVAEIRRDGVTGEPQSVRVKTTTGQRRSCWVKPEMLIGERVSPPRFSEKTAV